MSDNNKKNAIPIKFKYEIFLDDDVVEPSEYRDDLMTLRNAHRGDEVHIYINTYGGRLDTTVEFIQAIWNCEADVYTHLTKGYSAGSIIFLAGHIPVVYEFADMMIHHASGGYWGKMSDVLPQTKHCEKQVKEIYKSVYSGFLTDEELNSVLDGKDYYFLYDEIVERLEKRAKKHSEEAEQFHKENHSVNEAELKKMTKQQIIDMILNQQGV